MLFLLAGLELVYMLSPTTSQSLMSAVYNLGMSAGNLVAFGVLIIAAVYNWFPSSSSGAGISYLGNKHVAYYFWLLGSLMVLAIFSMLIIACCTNIELNVALEQNSDEQFLMTGETTTFSTSRSTTGLSSENEFSPAEMPEPHFAL